MAIERKRGWRISHCLAGRLTHCGFKLAVECVIVEVDVEQLALNDLRGEL